MRTCTVVSSSRPRTERTGPVGRRSVAQPVPPRLDQLRRVAIEAGIHALGATRSTPFTRTLGDLRERSARGLRAGMGFTYRRPEVACDPRRSLPGARTLVVGALGYPDRPVPPPTGPSGRVARYTRAPYTDALRVALGEVAAVLVSAGFRARVLADDNTLVDREAAQRAGLGWYGRNANLLLHGQGSWFVLGAVLTSAAIEESPAAQGVGGRPAPEALDVADAPACGTCTRCLRACPTGAIVAPGVVDANRCLSWLLQAEGSFPLPWREILGDRIYGCDDCQEVCPPNRPSGAVAVGDRRADASAWVRLAELLDDDDQAVLARAGRWYVARRDPRYLRRNALVVLGNVGDGSDPQVEALLARYLEHPDPLLRAHATWAARRLGRDDLLPAAEHDPEVLVERVVPVALAGVRP